MSVAPCAGDDFSCRSVHQTERSQKQIREHTWHPSTDRAARECSSPGNSKSHWSLNWLASHAHMPIWTIQAECKLLERRLEVSSGVPKNVGHPSCWGSNSLWARPPPLRRLLLLQGVPAWSWCDRGQRCRAVRLGCLIQDGCCRLLRRFISLCSCCCFC